VTLLDIVRDLEQITAREDQLMTLFVRPASAPGAEALLAPLTNDGRIPDSVRHAGFEYFLEADIALEVLGSVDHPHLLNVATD
jgi:hypothetical protein